MMKSNCKNLSILLIVNHYFYLLFFLFSCEVLIFYMVFRVDFTQYNRLLKEENNLKIEYIGKKKNSNLFSYKNQYEALLKSYHKILKRVPEKDGVYNLLNDISKVGTESDLIIELFSPRLVKSQNFLTEIAVDMVVLGEYRQLALFLSRILQLNCLVKFCDLEIKKIPRNEQKDSFKTSEDQLLRMSIRVKIYQKDTKYYE